MTKTTGLDSRAQEFVAGLSKSLKQQSLRVSPIELAELAGLAFELTFNGNRKEDKLANAIARGLSVRERMAAEEGGSMSAEEAARYLEVSKQSVLNLYHAGKVLAWRTEKQGSFRFPAWQFVDGQRLAGVKQVLAKLNETEHLDDWGKIGFFLQSHGIVKDQRPLDLLRQGKLDQALIAAEAYVE
jgi:hypothetical protein